MSKNSSQLRPQAHTSIRRVFLLSVLAGGVILAGILATLQQTETQGVFDNLVRRGNAEKKNDGFYDLTPDQGNKGGAVWFPERVSLNEPFIFECDINLGSRDGDGADGIAFVFQRASTGTNTIGVYGGGMGFFNISPSLDIEFDTWDNGSGFGDLPNDHICILKNGDVGNILASSVCAKSNCANIEDGANHRVKIEWTPGVNTLKVYFDSELRMTYTNNIVSNVFSGNRWVHFGMTAATGGASNLQRVRPLELQAVGENNSFPVEWLYVDAKRSGDNAIISWGTASEQNSDFFAVERSLDNQVYEELGQAPAAGTSLETREYSFTDPGITSMGTERIYYRLRQVDIDGLFEYSQVVEVQLEPASETFSLQLAPNPAHDLAKIQISGLKSKAAQVNVYNTNGQNMWKGTPVTGEEIGLDVASWPRGIYFVQLTDGVRKLQKTLVLE